MCAMLLAELGADVIRIERKGEGGAGLKRPRKFNLLLRSRGVVSLDLKNRAAVEVVLKLVERSDALIEGFRPGVSERLGLGPDDCLRRNPRLVYGRITGWGQDGPLAQAAGHDLNYIALTGALHAMGRQGEPPTVPLTVIGDFGGGALYLALGVLAAIIEAKTSGQGQVVDAAMVDGAASQLTTFYGLHAAGLWSSERGTNATDSGSHFCEVYECADGKWVAIAAIEDKFYRELLQRIGIDPDALGPQMDPTRWPAAKQVLRQKFRTRSRDEWCAILEGTDSCFSPVLSWEEAPSHPHIKARGTLIEVDGVVQPAPAPRFSRTKLDPPVSPTDTHAAGPSAALSGWLEPQDIENLRSAGTID
jgi:crotonobetainyl-CoA:carnitine CoA-transferase CaiB-like acyl-CoA transferase